MLKAMTLALAYGHLTVSADKTETAEAFNHDFYATIAAVIPILFLAIAVQGPLYNDLLKAALSAWERSSKIGKIEANFSWKQVLNSSLKKVLIDWRHFHFFYGAITVAFAIVVCGVVGEIQALVALERRHAEGHVLAYAIVLLGAVAAAPVGTLVRSLAAAGTMAAKELIADDAGVDPELRALVIKLTGPMTAVAFLAVFGYCVYLLLTM
jgi:hypothetical protein